MHGIPIVRVKSEGGGIGTDRQSINVPLVGRVVATVYRYCFEGDFIARAAGIGSCNPGYAYFRGKVRFYSYSPTSGRFLKGIADTVFRPAGVGGRGRNVRRRIVGGRIGITYIGTVGLPLVFDCFIPYAGGCGAAALYRITFATDGLARAADGAGGKIVVNRHCSGCWFARSFPSSD